MILQLEARKRLLTQYAGTTKYLVSFSMRVKSQADEHSLNSMHPLCFGFLN
jgi:hypothetical protein